MEVNKVSSSIQIGKTSNDPRVVDKSFSITKTVDCSVTGEISILNPVLLLAYDADLLGCNYFYWPLTGRYYFIDTISGVPGERLIIGGKVDVLKSFASQIKNTTCVIDRAKSNRSKWLDDGAYPMETSTQVQNYTFSSTPFTTTDVASGNYLLTVIGGPLT